MKKILSTIAATAVLATSGLALDTDKAYSISSLAMENFTGLDSGFAVILGGGLPVMAKGEAGPGTLVAEAELSFDLSSPSLGTTEISIFTMGAYVGYQYDINDKAFIKPRLGLVYASSSQDYSYNNGFTTVSGSIDDSTIGIAFGLQGGYKLNKQMDIIVGYNLVATNVSHLSAGIQYHF